MQRLQILDGARTAEVEGVLANADVARVGPLSLRNMCELVFDYGALPQRRASRGRLDLFAEAVLQLLVLGDRDGATVPEFGGGALIAPHASDRRRRGRTRPSCRTRSVALVHSDIRSCGYGDSA